jgi:hypothetical protein
MPRDHRHWGMRDGCQAQLRHWMAQQPNQHYTLQMVSGDPPILKAVFLTLTLEWRPLKSWVFITNITNEFNLWLHILRAYDASVSLGHQSLQGKRYHYGSSEWHPGLPGQRYLKNARAWWWLNWRALLKWKMAWQNRARGLSTQRTLHSQDSGLKPPGGNRGHWMLPIMTTKLTNGSPLAHCVPVTLVTPLDVEQPKVQDATPKLQEVTALAKHEWRWILRVGRAPH